MGLKDLAGTGALEAALTTTNEHLEAVLAELRRTNDERLSDMAQQLRALTETVDRLVAQLGSATP